MQIIPEQIASATRVYDDHPLVKVLRELKDLEMSKNEQIRKPHIVMVFDENQDGTDWVLHVFYHSANPLREIRLDVKSLLVETKVQPEDENDVVMVTYPQGYCGVCKTIGGQRFWFY